jgi:hypothetical protein
MTFVAWLRTARIGSDTSLMSKSAAEPDAPPGRWTSSQGLSIPLIKLLLTVGYQKSALRL